MLPISREDYFYEIRPRIVLSGCPTPIVIRSLDASAALEEGVRYRICVIPMTSDVYTDSRPPVFETSAVCSGGTLSFTHAFSGEQEHSVRLYREGGSACVLKTSVYSLKEDLFSRRPLLGDFHVHTCFSDGVESPEFVAAMYRQAGYDFVSITDHGRMDPSVRAIQAYRDIPLDFRIYTGEEVHPPRSHVHIVHFGGDCSVNERSREKGWLDEVEKRMASFTDLPSALDPFVHASCLQVIDQIHSAGGMAILCHPFWLADVHHLTNDFTALYLKNGYADAFELVGGQSNHENMLQIAFYQQLLSEGYEIPVVGNSDSHGTVDRVYFDGTKTLVLAENNGKDEIIDAVRRGYSIAMDEYTGQEPRFYSSFRMVSYALFLYEHYFPLHRELCYEEGRLMRTFATGEAPAGEELSRLAGRTVRHREAFFARYPK